MIKRISSFIAALVLAFVMLPSMGISADAEMLTGYPAESALIDELGLYANDTETFDTLDSMIKQKGDELGLNRLQTTVYPHRAERFSITKTA